MNMKKLIVNTAPEAPKQYPIFIGENLIENAFEYISECSNSEQFLIITTETVEKLWGKKLMIPNSHRLILPDGEEQKNFTTLQRIINKALDLHLERKDAIIAFGGGVIGDMAGFAASIYQRGIDFIQIPTTLLAQVDSSVGGKVAINHPLGKNMIGSFYQPKLVLADTNTLKTLDLRQLKTGLAEVLKYAFIEKSCNCKETFNLFDFLSENHDKIYSQDPTVIKELIYMCCSLKSAVVSQDEKEKGLRAILNFGHTFAHALEKTTDYKFYTHGEAVAIGMRMALALAYEAEMITCTYYELGKTLLNNYSLDISTNKVSSVNAICDAMRLDKKVESNKIRFVLPTGYQKVEIFNDISENLIKKVVSQEL